MSDIILQTRNISKRYGQSFAVHKANITVRKGEIYGLIGKNGAGKTTLLKIITGLTIPNAGEMELNFETSKKGIEAARSRTGCMIENPHFFPYLSASRNLEYFRLQRGIAEKDCIERALDIVGLSDTGNKKFKNFSLGMKQRLGLALAIMGNPDILILDEPINGLDPMGIAEFREIVKKLNKDYDTTVLISSHILGELSQIATKYGFIKDGKIIEEVTEKELSEKCRLCVSFKVSDTGKASTILENKLDCTEYEVLNNNEVRIFKYIDSPETINEAFVLNGIKVSSIGLIGTSLENYFIDLIGDDKNA